MTIPAIALSSNLKIPQLGFGTWQNKEERTCRVAVEAALAAGYRHVDTAQAYENEAFIGNALAASSVPRQELFITTKIWNGNLNWDTIIPSFKDSLNSLRTDYVDLLLIHFPVTEFRRPAWKRMEDILRAGTARAIGVSNYTVRHLEELLRECNIKPAVNQVELHVFLQQPELVAYCQANGIVLEAYSPLAHGYMMDNKTLRGIAKKHSKTYGQVMIRWCIEKGFVTLPKSVDPKRIKENFDVFDFELDTADMATIQSLESDLRTCWDPTHVA